jgi:6-pyruvoyltetrahydropterin/6-carboxytetrahydropterin synthase
MLTRVSKEFTFDAAHMLTGHEGLCKNLHGHTYKVVVAVSLKTPTGLMTSGPSEGMVLDFKDLKNALNARLFNQLDHSYIYNSKGGAAERAIAELLEALGMRTFDMMMKPTAENMARYFFEVIASEMGASLDYQLRLEKVTVWETPTSFAEVTE